MKTLSDRMQECTPWLTQEDTPKIIINDVTRRDGLQAIPWANQWGNKASVEMVHKMADVGVHQVEVGFAAMPEDPETKAVQRIAEQCGDREIMLFSLARLNVPGKVNDIVTGIKVLERAKYKGIHTFIGTSPEHLQSRGLTHEQIKAFIADSVKQVVDAGYLCQYSSEDLTRTDPSFGRDTYEVAVENGATILNLPDTLGYMNAVDYTQLVREYHAWFPEHVLSVHTHNDMGNAEQNALCPLVEGVAQRVEGTLMGIGERAGNADIAQIIMFLGSHPDPRYQALAENLVRNPEKMQDLLAYFSRVSGINQRPVSPGYGYEAIVNRSGIHQAEVAKMKETYIWLNPEKFGLEPRPTIDISPLSGKGGVVATLRELGINADEIASSDLNRFTSLVRNVFTSDQGKADITGEFGRMSNDDVQVLADDVYAARQRFRGSKPSEGNTKHLMADTKVIIKKAYDMFFAVQR